MQKWTCVVSQLSLTRVTYIRINQKFIDWVTRVRLNNHCNNKDLPGMKRQRMVTGFLHTFGIQAHV